MAADAQRLLMQPFGGKEGPEAQTRFAYKTSATQVLFLQHVIDSLKPGGRCGLVIDEGVLFRTTEAAFVQTTAAHDRAVRRALLAAAIEG